MANHKLTKEHLRALSKLATEGRLIVKLIGTSRHAIGLPSWVYDEFTLARALVGNANARATEAAKNEQIHPTPTDQKVGAPGPRAHNLRRGPERS